MRIKLFASFAIFCLLTICSSAFLFGQGIARAGDYRKHSDLQWQWAMDSLEDYRFVGDERVLDIGSGDGRITAYLAEKASKGLVIGMDISDEMTRYASETFDVAENPNLLFITGSATKSHFHRQFDLVFSSCCLHWVKEQTDALKAIERSLALDGKAILVVPGAAASNVGIRCREVANTKKWAPYLMPFSCDKVYYSWEEYETLFRECGLETLDHKVTHTFREFSDRADFADWLRPLLTGVNHLSEPMQENFLADLVTHILELVPQAEDGTISVPFLKMEMLLQSSCSSTSDPSNNNYR